MADKPKLSLVSNNVAPIDTKESSCVDIFKEASKLNFEDLIIIGNETRINPDTGEKEYRYQRFTSRLTNAEAVFLLERSRRGLMDEILGDFPI